MTKFEQDRVCLALLTYELSDTAGAPSRPAQRLTRKRFALKLGHK